MEISAVQSIKLAIEEVAGLSRDALHIYVGLGVFLVAVVVSRKPLRSSVPWFAVLAVAVAGELVDMIDDLGRLGTWQWSASLHDVLNTVFWPTALWLFARRGGDE